MNLEWRYEANCVHICDFSFPILAYSYTVSLANKIIFGKVSSSFQNKSWMKKRRVIWRYFGVLRKIVLPFLRQSTVSVHMFFDHMNHQNTEGIPLLTEKCKVCPLQSAWEVGESQTELTEYLKGSMKGSRAPPMEPPSIRKEHWNLQTIMIFWEVKSQNEIVLNRFVVYSFG